MSTTTTKHSDIKLAHPDAEPAPNGRPSHRPVNQALRPLTPGQRANHRRLIEAIRRSR